MKNKILFLSLFLFVFVFSGCVKKTVKDLPQISLEVWGIFDDSDVFREINTVFEELDPYVVKVNYKKITDRNVESFEKELTEALANGTGPDIVYFKSSWLPKHGNKIVPMPNSQEMLATFRNTFVDVAYDDFVYKNYIFAAPLYCDTLALYYNNDLLNQAGLVRPPATWSQLKQYTKILTKIDDYGNIKQSAIALGRSQGNGAVNRAGDIVMLMMMQGGANMNRNGTLFADLNNPRTPTGGPGEVALNFFTSFADSASPLYTWNAGMPYSVDAFRYGRVAMMLNYSYWYDRLKKADPKLDFSIAPVPQSGQENGKVNYANYWGLAVVKNANVPVKANYTNFDRVAAAWRYVSFVTGLSRTNKFDPTMHYLNKTRKPAARRDLLVKQKNDPVLGVFARQALTAKSWRQVDNLAIDEIFVKMINAVNTGVTTVGEAIDMAEKRINALVKDNL